MTLLSLVCRKASSQARFLHCSLQDRYHLLIHSCLDAGIAELQLLGDGGNLVIEFDLEQLQVSDIIIYY